MFDIPIVLFLEYFRQISGGIFDKFFLTCSYFGLLPTILLLISIVYWCFDKKLGEYLLISLSFTRILNAFIKVDACVYRPWIVDSNIHPLKEALPDATGYSFTSGHATSATILFCGIPIKRKNISKALKIVFILCLILICFSRCYVGVHTLTDIVFGIIFSLIILIIVKKVFDKYEDKQNFDLIILGVGIISSILLIIYSTFKGYPMDYDSAGKLIVDPTKMALESFKNAGFSIGILLSWVIERRFIKFSTEGNLESKVLRVLVGFIGFEILLTVIVPFVGTLFSKQIGNFITYFLFPVYVIILVPLFIKFFKNRG